eukprot:Ihof_evm3s343 gene=Ihof_evmTU3s343
MEHKRRKEIYTYASTSPLYTIGWSSRFGFEDRLATGSFIEEYANKVEIVQLDKEKDEYIRTTQFEHPYPTTKIMWIPDKLGTHPDLLATSGDYLRLWQVHDDGHVTSKCLLNSNKDSEYCAPLTSFDWNESDPDIVGTSSVDTTCTIWQLETQQVKAQLIAHDKEVYDICFSPGSNLFASVGADGSVRQFDMRCLEHSKILYEDPKPLLRVAWNKHDPNYIATMAIASDKVVVIDVRGAPVPVMELIGHQSAVSGLDWAPHSSHVCSA